MQITKKLWAVHNGKDVWLYTLDSNNLKIEFTNFGCTLKGIYVSINETHRNIILSYDEFADYLDDSYYLGCVIGRFANRVNGGKINIDGYDYQLSVNETSLGNHVHGGNEGFGKKIFEVVNESADPERLAVTLRYVSPDKEEGYPGQLDLTVTFELNAFGELNIGYSATTDKPTHINLTHHTYFNLDRTHSDISNHCVCIQADKYLESDERFLPTGKIKDVEGTRFDLRRIRKLISNEAKQDLPVYNTYYLLDQHSQHLQAILADKDGDISVGVTTSMPGILLYSGDYLGTPFKKNSGLCLECQFPPDAPNHPGFPSTLLRPGEAWEHFIKYKVTTEKNAGQPNKS